jgi:hypothetical protein
MLSDCNIAMTSKISGLVSLVLGLARYRLSPHFNVWPELQSVLLYVARRGSRRLSVNNSGIPMVSRVRLSPKIFADVSSTTRSTTRNFGFR